MRGTFLFLGTGGSAGVPMIGCKCAVCTSPSPFNHRLRPSGKIEIGGKSLLIDVGPDFRQQALKFGISHLDGLLLTHTHYDHIAGIDELRTFYLMTRKELPCLLSKISFETLQVRYSYLFQHPQEAATLSARLELHLLPDVQGEVEFLGLPIQYFQYAQGEMAVSGYRLGSFAYVSDIREYDDSIFSSLTGVEHLVLSALSEEPSFLHFSFAEGIEFAKKVGAKKTYFTHMNHKVDHEAVRRALPSGVELAYDGLEISFGV